MPYLVIPVYKSPLFGRFVVCGCSFALLLSMVYVKNHSNTRTGTGHEPDMEAIDISNDHEEESQTCAGVRSSGTLVRIPNIHTFLSFGKYRKYHLYLQTERDVASPLRTISASPSGVSEWKGNTFSTYHCRHRLRQRLASSRTKIARTSPSTRRADQSIPKYGSSMMGPCLGSRSEPPWIYVPIMASFAQQWCVPFQFCPYAILRLEELKKINSQ